MKNNLWAYFAATLLVGALASVINLASSDLATVRGVDFSSVVDSDHRASGLGPGYIENSEDETCGDAGVLIQPNCIGLSTSCECDAAALFGHDSVVPLTGRAETNFDANVGSIKCRSQSNVTCDCWHLCANQPN